MGFIPRALTSSGDFPCICPFASRRASRFWRHACRFRAQTRSTGELETVIVTGERTEADVPNKIEDVTADAAQIGSINAVNTEDMMKYMPSIVVRKRHYGDTQDPLATRTSGVGASARSLLYVDGILISSPIGNNNTSASPHFGIAAPEDIYGEFPK